MPVCTTRVESNNAYVYDGQVYIPNFYSAGTVGSKVLTTLRDKKKILGMRCPTCNRVYVPARSTCKDCFETITEWAEVSDKGTLLTYTVCNESTIAQPVEAPIIYGIVQLDGADNGFVHMIGEVDAEKLHVGMRLQAVFKESRTASILDIKYFKPM